MVVLRRSANTAKSLLFRFSTTWLLAVFTVLLSVEQQAVAFVVSPSYSSSEFHNVVSRRPTTFDEQRQKKSHHDNNSVRLRRQPRERRTAICYSISPPSKTTIDRPKTIVVSDSDASSSSSRTQEKIPFVIQHISSNSNSSPASEAVFKEISQMCIRAFFNDGPIKTIGATKTNGDLIPTHFWKEWQLRYLRALQQSDLKLRRQRHADTNMMFVARRVLPVDEYSVLTAPLILDQNSIYNLPSYQSQSMEYVQADVLGFVEVTLRPYGLGGAVGVEEEGLYETNSDNEASLSTPRPLSQKTIRPLLTNLSVQYEARQSGVGGRLMELCEQAVLQKWNKKEIILEVEDDNLNGLQFYQKRGYKILFEDPTSRRYDTNGFLLRQLRCNRKIMRKAIGHNIMSNNNSNSNNSGQSMSIIQAFARFRDSLFSSMQ
mmetsp:Transcript_22085/g.28574  ORF Transcript_22085/g.28574 Transcript_22085/m.28574 type:complete len:431 (-) Transcript_22085:374-1666(-)|eukprot:CAMPEP_0198146806 /NCGR_PEP_ID=MMETSP1443-20131203/31559_1 /TAXON_ID=186043 /ORGANISM="Entomoneis sp., Strain CCMP2396" /LENGTH=430 /DNA_ID=CAMNT_0043810887 /DNA_START=126 /DNA_END=1418 /DNA_ORIENTATION=-